MLREIDLEKKKNRKKIYIAVNIFNKLIFKTSNIKKCYSSVNTFKKGKK